MKPNRSIPLFLSIAFTLLSLTAGEFFYDLRALAQKTCINKDGTQTTSEPDNTYGEGGTKETVKDGKGRIIKVVKRDKQGRPRSSSTYLCGDKECGSDATWTYDDHGRLVSFVITYTDTLVFPGGTERRTIKYAGDDDKKGTVTNEVDDPKTNGWKPASVSQINLLDSESGADPVHDYSPDKPESIIGDLGRAESRPSPSPSPSPALWPKFKLGLDYKFDFKTSDGLKTETFTLPSGTKISINFPADLSVGDRFTGTLRTELAGKDEKQRARSQAELNKYVLLIGAQPTPATESMFTRTIPSTVHADEPYLVLMINDKQVGSATAPMAQNPATAPQNPQLPTCGQAGRTVVVADHCDGLITPTDSCTIGGVPLQPLAESPRMRVLQNTNQTPGPTQIKYVEQDREVTGPFQNLGVNITSPNTNLLRNQKTTMEVVALVQGIQQNVSLDVVNDTPGVVSISGGDNQHFTIHPSDVQADGTYHRTFTVTANQAGAWGATSTVSCLEAGPVSGSPQASASPGGVPSQPRIPVIPIVAPPTPTPSPGSHPPPTPTPTPAPSPSPCASPPPATTYGVKDLGALPPIDATTPHCTATGVNDAANVVGACTAHYAGGPPSGGWRAFRTDAGGALIKKDDELAFPAGFKGGTSFATAINGMGHVVGFYAATGSSDDKAFWHDGGKKSKMVNLHTKFAISRAFALNIHDDVVGAAYSPAFGPISFGISFSGHAVIWPGAEPASMKDLNDDLSAAVKADWVLVAAFAISDDGDIVGRAYNKKLKKYHAFLLKGVGGAFFDLGALKEDIFDSSAAYAINECGEKLPVIDRVVGYTYTPADFHYGFLWTEATGLMAMKTVSGYPEGYAKAINKKGEVVGAAGDLHTSIVFDSISCFGTCFTKPTGDAHSHGVWYNGKELLDLNKLIPDFPGYEIEVGNGINDKGQIVGSAFYKPPTYKGGGLYAKAVLLTPAGLISTGFAPKPKTSSTAACPLSLPSGGYIFDNWNICGVKNGPTKDTTFTVDAPYFITLIATYHWNYGSGALPGGKGISLKDASGKMFGPWSVTTSAGSGGKANVNWECHPGITLPAGTYTIIDPDPATWSQNDGSGNSGFGRVAGSPKK